MRSQYAILSKGKWSARPQMEIQHGLASVDQDRDSGEGINMENMSRMIEDEVKKAVEGNGLGGEEVQQGGNGSGIGHDAGQVCTPVGATMSPELVAMLLNNQRPRNTEGNHSRIPDMICYRCGGIGHRAGTCTNTPRPQLVDELMARLDFKRCNDCGKYGHPDETC